MKTASQIMESKAFIKAEIDKKFSNSDELWENAEAKLSSIMEKYHDLPKGVHMHTDNFIFPSAAIYLTLKEVTSQEDAYEIVENAAIDHSMETGRKLAKMMGIPGMKGLFIKIWNPLTKKMFGAGSGFKNVFYQNKKDEYRMDVVACPYNKYLTELGCPELTKIFCANDDRCYGNLPGIEFKRSGTLGTGAERCDFYLRKL